MPNRDKTGPMGEGPLTGGGRGPCGANRANTENNETETDSNPNALPPRLYLRRGRTFGGGRGGGRGMGAGWRGRGGGRGRMGR